MWKPTTYREEDVAAFREAMADSPIDAVLIHAVYLLNCASEDAEIRAKSLTSLTHSLRVGQAIGASAVVLHPGSAKTGDVGQAIARAGETIAEALAESEGCELHLENTAGTGGTLGRSFEELAELLDAAGAGERLGVCLDSCHLLASGYDIRTGDGVARRCARARASSVAAACARCTSTTPRRRSAPTATATPISVRASSDDGLRAPSSRRRRCRGCRACSRPPARIAKARRARKSPSSSACASRRLQSAADAPAAGRAQAVAAEGIGASACSSSARSVGVCCTR